MFTLGTEGLPDAILKELLCDDQFRKQVKELKTPGGVPQRARSSMRSILESCLRLWPVEAAGERERGSGYRGDRPSATPLFVSCREIFRALIPRKSGAFV